VIVENCKIYMSYSHVITTCKYIQVDYKQFINDIYKLNCVEAYMMWSFDDAKNKRDSSQESRNSRRAMYLVPRILERIP